MKRRYLFMFIILLLVIAKAVDAPGTVTVQVPETATLLQIAAPQLYYHKLGENFTLNWHVFNYSGAPKRIDVTCMIDIYNSSRGKETIDTATVKTIGTDYDYQYTIVGDTIKQPGRYSYIIYCNNSAMNKWGWLNANFEVTNSGKEPPQDLSPFNALIYIPLLFAALLAVGAFSVDQKKHTPLRIFLYLVSLFMVFMSLWNAMYVINDNFFATELLDNIGVDIWIMGTVIFVILAYFVIYLIYVGFRQAAQDKEELRF